MKIIETFNDITIQTLCIIIRSAIIRLHSLLVHPSQRGDKRVSQVCCIDCTLSQQIKFYLIIIASNYALFLP